MMCSMPKGYVSEMQGRQAATVRPSPAPYADVDTIDDACGLRVIISQRRANGQFTIAIMKRFERDGAAQSSSFFPAEMVPDAKRMLDIAEARVLEIVESGSHPFPIRTSR